MVGEPTRHTGVDRSGLGEGWWEPLSPSGYRSDVLKGGFGWLSRGGIRGRRVGGRVWGLGGRPEWAPLQGQ